VALCQLQKGSCHPYLFNGTTSQQRSLGSEGHRNALRVMVWVLTQHLSLLIENHNSSFNLGSLTVAAPAFIGPSTFSEDRLSQWRGAELHLRKAFEWDRRL
jgi:hypothetical protein